MKDRITTAIQIWKYFGLKWIVYRAKYAIQQRLGIIKRQLPSTTWDAQPLDSFLIEAALAQPERYAHYRQTQSPVFFFSATDREKVKHVFEQWDKGCKTPVAIADEISEGQLRYFEHTIGETGTPVNWFRNPFTGQEIQTDRHWTTIPDFGMGDIKVIWEPSRFSFVYTLVRAYWRTGDEKYAELFWSRVEAWREANPPQVGPNWKCGQEATFRVMAWCFGLYGFAGSVATTPDRITRLAQMIAVSGNRISNNLDYALSQRNNHGISEGVGLWTIGLLFPELQQATTWKEEGRRVLEHLAQELIYDDGAFAQNSMNYHRLMLHDYIWAIRLGDINQQPLSDNVRARISKATSFLFQCQDTETGRVPLYGPNDGALILPLNNCDYLNFRPVINSAMFLLNGQRPYTSKEAEPAAWEEDLFWLFGIDALNTSSEKLEPKNFSAEPSGYYTLRSNEGFVFTRCGRYLDRPAHADALHLDLWWKGQNIACDAGTYSYNAPAPWNYELARTHYHNTITVDGLDQMQKKGKFLWLPWLRGWQRTYLREDEHQFAYWEGEHDGYHRFPTPISHRRGIVQLPEEQWLVVDCLSSDAPHNYRLHWLLVDTPYQWNEKENCITLNTVLGQYFIQAHTSASIAHSSLVRCAEDSAHGWRATHYQSREPALSLSLNTKESTVWFWTLFGPQNCAFDLQEEGLTITGTNWQTSLQFRAVEGESQSQSLLQTVSIQHNAIETLQIDY